MGTDVDPDEITRQVTESLMSRYSGLDEDVVATTVRARVAALEAEPVHDYIAVLAEREARRELGLTPSQES